MEPSLAPSPSPGRSKLSAFSVLLIMAALTLVGAAMIPLLNIQYLPAPQQSSLRITFTWPNASAHLIEREVTSKIEGMVAAVKGVQEVSSASGKGYGRVSVTFKKGMKIDAARFEIAMLIRQLYTSLPRGVSYPSLSLSTSGTRERPMLTYTLNANLSPDQIERYANIHLLVPISQIKGVNSVLLSGATPYEWMVTFDPDRARVAGIETSDLVAAINNHLGDELIGTLTQRTSQGEYQMSLKMSTGISADTESSLQTIIEGIPIKQVEGHLLYLRDFASVLYQESLPTSYYRINGLNTINITIYPDRGSNIPKVARQVKEQMELLEAAFPADFSVLLAYDASEFIDQELNRIALRTGLSLLILLLFVFAVSRSWRYLLVIFITLVANIFVAFILYKVLGVEIHLYSLAGITISLGIIIDTSIIMIDHYSYYHDRRAFIAILAALLTTIGSLSIIFFLPEAQKVNLVDFSLVIIINLSISLLIALLFIPSLLEKFPVRKGVSKLGIRGRRRVVCISRRYGRYIDWSRRHRWIYVVMLIFGFGLPIHLLPDKLKEGRELKTGIWPDLYHQTIGSTWYQNHREIFETVLGGSLRLFTESIASSGFYREPERTTLTIHAGMPEGCSIHQLDQIMRYMENYLSRFDEIDLFQTSITDYNQGSITVTFKEEAERTGFPLMLKGNVIQQAINYGGATWGVIGVDNLGFNNNITSAYKGNQIIIRGYNYETLYGFAQQLVDSLRSNPRVSEPEIYGQVGWQMNASKNEYYIDYDYRRIATTGLNMSHYYAFLEQQLFSQPLRPYFDGQRQTQVSLISSGSETFDLWQVQNSLVEIDSLRTKLTDIGTIEKQRLGNDIYKIDQEYQLIVAYDFIGSVELGQKVLERHVDYLNEQVLPVGYKAKKANLGWSSEDQQQQVWLIFLVIVIIYFLCSILFESLLKPLVIILMIPVSFIGVFLTFFLGEFGFDQGGFAAFVMLCGIVVNAGIYLVNEYNIQPPSNLSFCPRYLKAYNRKIIPILLTVFSTVLGLIPFLYDGKDEVFWFSFAVGAMGGMLFSLVALLIYLPIFLPGNRLRKRSLR